MFDTETQKAAIYNILQHWQQKIKKDLQVLQKGYGSIAVWL